MPRGPMMQFYLNTTIKNGKYLKHKSILLGSSHSPQHKVPWFSKKANIRITIKRKGFISKTNFGYGKKCKEAHCKKRNLNKKDILHSAPALVEINSDHAEVQISMGALPL